MAFKSEVSSHAGVTPKKEVKTWNFLMGGKDEGKAFRDQIKQTWDKLTPVQLAMITTEGTLTDAIMKAYDIPEEMAQTEVTNWLKSL